MDVPRNPRDEDDDPSLSLERRRQDTGFVSEVQQSVPAATSRGSTAVDSTSPSIPAERDSDSSPFAQGRCSIDDTGVSPAQPLTSTNPESITTRLRRDSRSSSHRIRTGSRSCYFGTTTNYHIYSDAYHSKMSALSEAQNEEAQEFLASISADAHAYLMDRFWACYNLVIQVVHREAFEADRLSDRGRYYSRFLHICMLGIGYRYADRAKYGVHKLAIANRESVLHQEAKRLVEHELKMPGGMPSIQALILLGDLECGTGNYNTGWLYAGMASRLCFDLGLNQDSTEPDLSRLEQQVRKTVLWSCFTIDRYWGLFLGRRTSIKWTDLALTDKDHPMRDCFPMGQQRSLETEIYEALIHLMELASRLTDAVHCEHPKLDASAYFLAAGLDLELRSWYNRLSNRLKWSADKLETAPSGYFILHQQYHALFILLYRPFIPDLAAGATQPGQEPCLDMVVQVARDSCFSHAVQVARIIGAYRQRFDMKSMFVTGMQHAATAALALVDCMPTIARKNQPDTLLYLQCLAEALYANASTYFPAKVMSEILFTVIGEYRTSQVQTNQVQPSAAAVNVPQMSRPAQEPPVIDLFEQGQALGLSTMMQEAPDISEQNQGSALGLGQDGIAREHPYSGVTSRYGLVGQQQWVEGQAQVDPLMNDALNAENAAFDTEIWESIMDMLSQPMEY
ncbi:hypothetical protein G7046_g249 [Stylonectria norvegica]|nr:hypothetical protein G7046_g249 [Stylonectria norvegica]